MYKTIGRPDLALRFGRIWPAKLEMCINSLNESGDRPLVFFWRVTKSSDLRCGVPPRKTVLDVYARLGNDAGILLGDASKKKPNPAELF
ncbi:hypothetical protein [Xanthomonas hortorum]|uniref:Uncharacterized protein n=1 Tax=Xanthomonas hortorum pv. hederae TaxID=453603 RepID=A0A9X4H4Q7_9XANT|nr:hypothetical protein [Xanthomonas hortorum]MDC8638247.1 hypothetical protein [Xanthomonas hortorum pv. hederae]